MIKCWGKEKEDGVKLGVDIKRRTKAVVQLWKRVMTKTIEDEGSRERVMHGY